MASPGPSLHMLPMRELERVKRCLAWGWRKRKKDLDQTGVRVFFGVIRAAKPQYHLALVASADWQAAALFEVTWTLLGKGDSDTYLQGCVEEFPRCLEDKIAQICSHLNTKHDASCTRLWRCPGRLLQLSGKVLILLELRKWTGSFGMQMSPPAHSIHVALGCLRHLGWVQVTGNSSLLEGVFPAPLKRCCSLLKRLLLAPTFWTSFVQSP